MHVKVMCANYPTVEFIDKPPKLLFLNLYSRRWAIYQCMTPPPPASNLPFCDQGFWFCKYFFFVSQDNVNLSVEGIRGAFEEEKTFFFLLAPFASLSRLLQSTVVRSEQLPRYLKVWISSRSGMITRSHTIWSGMRWAPCFQRSWWNLSIAEATWQH